MKKTTSLFGFSGNASLSGKLFLLVMEQYDNDSLVWDDYKDLDIDVNG